MLSIAGTRRSLLYGTGSSSDEPFRSEGVGDAACSGPRDDRSLSLLVGRVLLLRVAPYFSEKYNLYYKMKFVK